MRNTGSERLDVEPASPRASPTVSRDSVLPLWGEAVPCGCTSPCVMTFRHAQSLTAHVRPIALVACHAISQQKGCK